MESGEDNNKRVFECLNRWSDGCRGALDERQAVDAWDSRTSPSN